MKLVSDSFADNAMIPGEFAFCVPGSIRSPVAMSKNRNPHLAWYDAPPDVKSFALICHDLDAPSKGDDVNQRDREIPADLPRVDFFHWVLINMPSDVRGISAGSCSKTVVPRGKSGPRTMVGDHEVRHGLNDYTAWFSTDKDMGGTYFGYDGPCPPWNDSIVHRYVFTLFALNVALLDIGDRFTGTQVRDAMAGHILTQADWSGRYTMNRRLVAA